MSNKLFFIFYALFMMLTSHSLYAQTTMTPDNTMDEVSEHNPASNFNIFVITQFEDNPFLVSLSDIYDSDKVSILGEKNRSPSLVQSQYTLKADYRAKFLAEVGLLETDTVFIYNFSRSKLVSLPVKNFNVIAYLNIYQLGSEGPFSSADYMIGFEIPPSVITQLQNDISDTFVYIGSENPFNLEPLSPLVWKKINASKFPKTTQAQDKAVFADTPVYLNYPIGETYFSENNELQYYIQNRIEDNDIGQSRARRLIIVEAKTQKIIIDHLLYESEGASLAALNGVSGYDDTFQWAGKLFKNKPPVTFGYTWTTFGCPSILVVAPSKEWIPINCDNRH